MDVLEAIMGRRSIRKYLTAEVESEKVDTILEAGRWAPSASNKQPWHFIVIRNPELRKKLADVHPYGDFMAESPVVIVVLGNSEKHPRYHLADPHNAVQNMLLAAYSLGLGTCWMGVRDTDIEQFFKETLEVPDKFRVICSISLGYHDVEARKNRIELDDMLSYEKYGSKK
ncbi:MAG: nitroreductase family protein [Candidatus Thorarchaeota archaeon]